MVSSRTLSRWASAFSTTVDLLPMVSERSVKQQEVVAEDAGAQTHGVPGGDGTVGPHLQSQLVEVGEVARTRVFSTV